MIAPVAYRLDKGPPPDALRRARAAIGIAPTCACRRGDRMRRREFLGVNRDCPALQRFRLGAGKIRRAGDCHTEEALRSAIGTPIGHRSRSSGQLEVSTLSRP